ncbi:MAG: helix-turn-helix transcriptional regulator [Hymenobacter sp.]|nr:helix-turn-helix transcriptional regulator [Hymenobacter sp.]
MKYDSEMYARPALVSSAALAWPGLRVEQYQLDATKLPAHHHEHHLLLLHQGAAPVTSRRQQGRQVEEAVFRKGDAGLYPSGEYGTVAWDGPTDTIHLYLDDQHLENLARQGMDLTHFTLRDRYRFGDALLNQLGQRLLGAVGTQHALGLFYIEALTNALCCHLIEHHATYERRVAPGPRLSAPVLARIDAYLEAHADTLITLETMAGLAHLSAFHFARRFKQTTGVSPYQYVLGWKIRRARQLLRAADAPIAAISDALGFASPAHFSVAFKRGVGQSPREFRRG